MAKPRVNPIEEDILLMSEFYEELVYDFLDELAPFRPFWSKELSADEALWRWLEVREPIMSWLAEVGVALGYDYAGLMANLEDIWFGTAITDLVPVDILLKLPRALLLMVQAGPQDAADHIRKMERLFEQRKTVAEQMAAAREQAEPKVPEPLLDMVASSQSRPV